MTKSKILLSILAITMVGCHDFAFDYFGKSSTATNSTSTTKNTSVSKQCVSDSQCNDDMICYKQDRDNYLGFCARVDVKIK